MRRCSDFSANQKRVAICNGFRHVVGCHYGARARLVLDDHGLAEVLGQFLGEDARNDVVAAAGGKADNDVDRPCRISCRIILRCGGLDGNKQTRNH